MILARPAAGTGAHGSRAADVPRGHAAGGDPLDLARRMILASPSGVNPVIPRLATKAG
jgi:hypothetical protein